MKNSVKRKLMLFTAKTMGAAAAVQMSSTPMTNYFCLLKSPINRLYSQANIDLTIAVLIGNSYNYAVNKILGELPCKLCDVCVLGCE